MRTYELRLIDDRYATPTVAMILVDDTEAARLRADRILALSHHHRRIDVLEGGRPLFSVETP